MENIMNTEFIKKCEEAKKNNTEEKIYLELLNKLEFSDYQKGILEDIKDEKKVDSYKDAIKSLINDYEDSKLNETDLEYASEQIIELESEVDKLECKIDDIQFEYEAYMYLIADFVKTLSKPKPKYASVVFIEGFSDKQYEYELENDVANSIEIGDVAVVYNKNNEHKFVRVVGISIKNTYFGKHEIIKTIIGKGEVDRAN